MSVSINGDTGISGVNGTRLIPAYRGGTSNDGIMFDADKVSIATASQRRLTVDSSGRLGIGVASPSQQLHLSASSGDVAALIECPGHPILRLKTTGTSDNTSVDFADSDSDTKARLLYTHNTDTFKVISNGTEHLEMNSDGLIHYKYTRNNATVPEGLFINNQSNVLGNNASLTLSNDSGNRKKVAISAVDFGGFGASDLVFALDGADSGELSLATDEKARLTTGANLFVNRTTGSGKVSVSAGAGEFDFCHSANLVQRSWEGSGGGSGVTTIIDLFDMSTNNNARIAGEFTLMCIRGGFAQQRFFKKYGIALTRFSGNYNGFITETVNAGGSGFSTIVIERDGDDIRFRCVSNTASSGGSIKVHFMGFVANGPAPY